MRPSDTELRAIRDSVGWVGRLSDGLVRAGPFSLGVDGVLSWIPGVGEIYSLLAGGFIVLQGARARVPLPTLAAAAALIACRTLFNAAPFAGAAFADLFTAHKWAAGLIVRSIDGALGDSASASRWPPWAMGMARHR